MLVSVVLVVYHLLYTLTQGPLGVGECCPRCLLPAARSLRLVTVWFGGHNDRPVTSLIHDYVDIVTK